MTSLTVYVDGASRGNPGPASVGIVFVDEHQKPLKTISKKIGNTTNNVAEYLALILATQEALGMGAHTLEVFTDSELLARQFQGKYKVKDPNLKILFFILINLKPLFKQITVTHVPREKNKLADEAANQAFDEGFLV